MQQTACRGLFWKDLCTLVGDRLNELEHLVARLLGIDQAVGDLEIPVHRKRCQQGMDTRPAGGGDDQRARSRRAVEHIVVVIVHRLDTDAAGLRKQGGQFGCLLVAMGSKDHGLAVQIGKAEPLFARKRMAARAGDADRQIGQMERAEPVAPVVRVVGAGDDVHPAARWSSRLRNEAAVSSNGTISTLIRG